MSKALLIAALSPLFISAVIGILIFLFGDFNENQNQLLLTTLAIGGFSLIGLANTAGKSAWWWWPLRPVGLATAVVALALAVPLIWEMIQGTEVVWRAFATLSVLALTSAHVSLLGALDPGNTTIRVWRLAAMLIAASVACLIVYAVWWPINDAQRELYFRGIGVAAILDVLGTVGLYPLSRLLGNSRRGALNKPSTSAPRRKPAKRRLRPSR